MEKLVQYRIFDTHTHYDDESFEKDRENLIKDLLENKLSGIVNIGANLESSLESLELSKKFNRFFVAVGVHPDEVSELDEDITKFEKLREILNDNKVVAVGEIGLDYYEWEEGKKTHTIRERQKYWFKKQLELAKEFEKPIVVHSRDAAKDTFDILKESETHRGVIHCYSYSKEMAREFVDLGFFLGIGGVLTFKNATKLKEVVKYIGIDRLVLETDSPYLSPVPYRGKRNDSGKLDYVVDELSNLLNLPKEEVIKRTYLNAINLYGLEGVYNAKLS